MTVEELLEEFSLTHVRKNKGMVLSGGERRRTEIARALALLEATHHFPADYPVSVIALNIDISRRTS